MKNVIPIHTNSWKKLTIHFEKIKDIHLIDFFKNDNKRYQRHSFLFQNKILIDMSKNRIDSETISLLLELAEEMNLSNQISSMFTGEKINFTENRSVLHTALRNLGESSIFVDGVDVMPKISFVLNKMKTFSEKIIHGKWKGYSGKKIRNIVNIGIGGSDLGPKMVTMALNPYRNHLNVFFLSNIDSTELFNFLKVNDFETTIFLISSKTFTTKETITNATIIKDCFLKRNNCIKSMEKHFFAITANITAALDFGIVKNNIFQLWDWVGGRYSLWSSMGLSIVLSIGFDNFIKLLRGAYDMDMHFQYEKLSNNIPVLLGLIGIWYNNFFHSETELIVPYDQYLSEFPSYIQQSSMESNGKNIDKNGNHVLWNTSPVIWGSVGINGQHSFYQLLHQGTRLIPCDFIASIFSHHPIQNNQEILLSNFFAQTHALAFGNFFQKNMNYKNNCIENEIYVEKFKYFEGNRPSNSFLLKKLDPYSLGALIALYEHKIFTQGIILNICSFDQWGVELGKKISDDIFNSLLYRTRSVNYDSSTNSLIKFYHDYKVHK
ncbi:glucose-6-phosphate isomerase [Buchnera aphidicola]|uniref:glucose-6-phosphate isomerase n=1 Tax=Buchnera aphidicola TaxID=9 RepID=UPI0031B896B8